MKCTSLHQARLANERQDDLTSNDNEALKWAIMDGHLDITRFLLEDASPKMNMKKIGNSVILVAMLNGHLDIITYFFDDARRKFTISQIEDEAVQGLITRGQLQMLKYILQKGYRLRKKHLQDYVLCRAAEAGHVSMVRYILEETDIIFTSKLYEQFEDFPATRCYKTLSDAAAYIEVLKTRYSPSPNFTKALKRSLIAGSMKAVFENDLYLGLSQEQIEDLVGVPVTGERQRTTTRI